MIWWIWHEKDTTSATSKNHINALEDSFGELEHRENFAEALNEVAGTVVQDNMPDYLEMLQNAKHGSLLENIHADNWQDCFQNILKNSVAYMTMVRCGCNGYECGLR